MALLERYKYYWRDPWKGTNWTRFPDSLSSLTLEKRCAARTVSYASACFKPPKEGHIPQRPEE